MMRKRRAARALAIAGGITIALVVLAIAIVVVEPRFAYVPDESDAINPERFDLAPRFDVWGVSVFASQIAACDRAQLSPARGAVAIDERTLRLGRDVFYRETFGNERFLTGVLGIVDGPLTLWQFAKAIVSLEGEPTTNLRVALARDATIGGRMFRAGELVDTGLDVPRGSLLPLGMTAKISRRGVEVGISCALCHSTVDRETGKVIHGAPNADLSLGLLLAMASNSASYFAHADRRALDTALARSSTSVTGSDGQPRAVPDARTLEDAVDAVFLQWPPGDFDSTIDLVSDATDMPHTFTRDGHPYGWSGFAAVGPFNGLSVLSNNVHALNADTLAQADASAVLFGVDKEAYIATVLQRAASRRYRYDVASKELPSAFFARVDPTLGTPGMVETVVPPSFPKSTYATPDGLFASSPGRPFFEQVNAVSAWQNTLVPPRSPVRVSDADVERGRAVFTLAGCESCHAGPALSNNRVNAVSTIGSEPIRARALARTEAMFGAPVMYPFDTPVPVPRDALPMPVPLDGVDPEDLKLAWAHGGSEGGYKTPSLVGLYWTAPYLHDGGVSVATNATDPVGVEATQRRHVAPDPALSLLALVDRRLRARVVAANDASSALAAVHVRGVGHEFWVDGGAGFSADDQRALVGYLLMYEAPPPPPADTACPLPPQRP